MFPSHLILPISGIKSYERNARTHSTAQIQQISDSIRQFGFCNPVLVDEEYSLIAGHGRLAAAQLLRYSELPAIVVTGLSPAQKQALRLADNKLALNAGWDDDLLRSELGDLRDAGFDLALTGFGDDELGALFADRTAGLTDPDDVPEAPAEPVTQPGDVWLLGRHRLVCGDATSEVDVSLALDGRTADCVFTSPPYGVGVEYDGYDDTVENLREMLPKLAASWRKAVVPGGFAVVNFGDIIPGRDASQSADVCEYPMAVEYWPAFRSAGWTLWTRRIWQKPHARVHSPWAIQSCRAASDWEHLWVWKAPGKPIAARGQFSAFGVWDTSHDHGVDVGKEVHGAGMAVSLATRGIETHSRPGTYIAEPFSGTGTTIIAAEMTGRTCHAIEISPAYVDCGIIRWQNFTGAEATLERTGQTYSEVAACRSNADTAERPSPTASSGSISEASTPLGASHATA